MNLTNKLNRKITIYNYEKVKNELGEFTYSFIPLKTIFSQVLPLKNSLQDINEESISEISQYKFIIRKQSLKGLKITSIIEFDNDKYNIDYWNLDFKTNEFVEIFATKKRKQ